MHGLTTCHEFEPKDSLVSNKYFLRFIQHSRTLQNKHIFINFGKINIPQGYCMVF